MYKYTDARTCIELTAERFELNDKADSFKRKHFKG